MPRTHAVAEAPELPQVPSARVRTKVRVPLRFGDGYRVEADILTFHDLADGAEHLALALGNPAAAATPLVRLHSECLTGDVFGSERCDCGPQLREAVEQIAHVGGYLLYLRQEGRGIGLYNKLDAYALQDGGRLDTYAANAALGLPEDGRDYTAAAQMLHTLGVDRIDLLSNNTDKAEQLAALGIEVATRVPTGVHTSPSNLHYLRTKAHGTALTHAHTIQLLPAGA
ncbi:GTP cyclohydrolase II [Kitasatospora sp. MAP12-15]|nr:GTP cyclohydrolase II [Kitasatospora sp. MAP12-44]